MSTGTLMTHLTSKSARVPKNFTPKPKYTTAILSRRAGCERESGNRVCHALTPSHPAGAWRAAGEPGGEGCR